MKTTNTLIVEKKLTVEKKHILYVTLNRPELHNAFNPEMIESLTGVFTYVDPSIQAVILQGNGPSFSAGADLNWMKSMVNYELEENLDDSKKLFEMFEAGFHCPCPLIGKFHGNVIGGGLGLASICDIGVAASTTRFCFSEVRLGLAPALISPFVLSKVKISMVSEWMLTGQSFNSVEAKEAGLIQYSDEGNNLDSIIKNILNRLFQSGPEAVRATKELIRSYSLSSWDQMRDRVVRCISERRVSAEGQEGLRAFLEKRKAHWKADQ